MQPDSSTDIHDAETAEWEIVQQDSNPEPLTDDPDAHLVGTGAGGLAGEVAVEVYDPAAEFGYWHDHSPGVTQQTSGSSSDEYASAYRYGRESQKRYPGQRFESVEIELANGWDRVRGDSGLSWGAARVAVRDAWHRLEPARPVGDDGRR